MKAEWMVITHNFYVFFAFFYASLLAAGILAGFIVGHYTGLNAGYVVNIVCFCAAVQLSMTRFGGRFIYIDGPSPLGIGAIVKRQGLLIAAIFGVIGVAVDMTYYAASSYLFTGAFKELNYLRLPVMAAVYAALSYVFFTSLKTPKVQHG